MNQSLCNSVSKRYTLGTCVNKERKLCCNVALDVSMGVRVPTLIKWHGVHVGEEVHLEASTQHRSQLSGNQESGSP